MIIASKIKTYSLEIVEDALGQRQRILGAVKHSREFYFIDAGLYELYKDRIDSFVNNAFIHIVPAQETNKEYVKLADYFRLLIEAGFTRNDVLVTMGGGVLQDISGFIASTLYRGIKWIFIPTTLLAQADSCIGSKTSINFGDIKNLIGTFYPPDFIAVDPFFTCTLSVSEFNSGMGEILKFHLLSDTNRVDFLKRSLATDNWRNSSLLDEVILSTLEIKKSYFEADEFDTGRRNLLNYGHCFGHALESASHFGIAHGEAVLIGMGVANNLALKRGLMLQSQYDMFEDILSPFYPAFDWSKVSVDDILMYMKKDKKRTGVGLVMIMGESIGVFKKFDDVQEDEIRLATIQYINNQNK